MARCLHSAGGDDSGGRSSQHLLLSLRRTAHALLPRRHHLQQPELRIRLPFDQTRRSRPSFWPVIRVGEYLPERCCYRSLGQIMAAALAKTGTGAHLFDYLISTVHICVSSNTSGICTGERDGRYSRRLRRLVHRARRQSTLPRGGQMSVRNPHGFARGSSAEGDSWNYN
jgi:hypothetical protein